MTKLLAKSADSADSTRRMNTAGCQRKSQSSAITTSATPRRRPITGIVQVATHIVELDVDTRLSGDNMDANLVEEIARVTIRDKVRRNYSFATKYCAFHRPGLYPIYDSLVHDILNTLLKQGETFDSFVPGEQWRTNYAIWHSRLPRSGFIMDWTRSRSEMSTSTFGCLQKSGRPLRQ
ncbi:hypothetical protein [Mycobacterium sp. 852002-51961_SCH5331710]|uniref:hypothetical protein n=1 Tax=Mycobacterium sp. 852002-51961_SCH5331710 TaxID=1834105 RepID=UPI0007FE5371|nr:hypothetical protein [Mycobacterium sp. 852002-51961_SCH5331710]OBB45434.1 hypothetical protein A5752_02105 [Mycobacterium sp. 852002-51961_SCH5331710]